MRKFRERAREVGLWLDEELDSIIAGILGLFYIQHKSDGGHSDITADSATIAGDVTSTGDGTFDGNVTADADGKPVVVGEVGSTLDTGMRMTRDAATNDWSIGVELGQFSANPSLIIRDIANDNTVVYALAFRRLTAIDAAPAEYVLGTMLSLARLYLGRNNPGERWYEVNASTIRAATAIYERGRSAALGDWTAYTPTRTADGGTWTGGDVFAEYEARGDTLCVNFSFNGGTLSASVNQIYISLPTGFTVDIPSGGHAHGHASYNDGAVWHAGAAVCYAAQGETRIRLFKNDGGGFPAGTFYAWGSIRIPI